MTMGTMLAAVAVRADPADPLAALEVRRVPRPDPPLRWSVVDVRAASLNPHDLWSLRGVGLSADRLPMVLGTDAAGVTADGQEVVVHAVIGATGHGVGPQETRSILSERYPGTLAEQVAVPTWNLVPKPPELTFVEAACLPTAWLTAYRMLFVGAGLRPGDRVLVQGAGGGVSTAAVQLLTGAIEAIARTLASVIMDTVESCSSHTWTSRESRRRGEWPAPHARRHRAARHDVLHGVGPWHAPGARQRVKVFDRLGSAQSSTARRLPRAAAEGHHA